VHRHLYRCRLASSGALASAAIAALKKKDIFEATFLLEADRNSLETAEHRIQGPGLWGGGRRGRLLPVAMARVIGQETERR